ncbi:PIG-L deacetylase family protein [Oryzobacter telluris]|uniref:PIG-L deacetylase family protein n=1 Tax=Oryzobacter telluris TaxID=3149179 RepID=UPI00370D2A8B
MLDPNPSSRTTPSDGSGPAPGGLLPPGVDRAATPPQRVAVLWCRRSADAATEALAALGLIPLLLDPTETTQFLDAMGEPSVLVVDCDALDDAAMEVLAQTRSAHPRLSVCALAGAEASRDGLLRALRLGVSEVVDPDDAEQLLATLTKVVQAPPAVRVLAVGAHPDDVEIGCGGTLLRHRDAGHAVTVLTLTLGAQGGPAVDRRREAVGAATRMGAELLLADLTDTRLDEEVGLTRLVEDVVATVRPSVVYVHSTADQHQDHRAVHDAVVVATRRVPEVYCYQSPSSRVGFSPTRFVRVDDTLDEKVDLLGVYRSQSARHYLEPDLVTATARYWARQLPHIRHAEPFEVHRASGDGPDLL